MRSARFLQPSSSRAVLEGLEDADNMRLRRRIMCRQEDDVFRVKREIKHGRPESSANPFPFFDRGVRCVSADMGVESRRMAADGRASSGSIGYVIGEARQARASSCAWPAPGEPGSRNRPPAT